jgi:hypothetical protein
MTIAVLLLTSSLAFSLRHYFSYLYSNDEAVAKVSASIMIVAPITAVRMNDECSLTCLVVGWISVVLGIGTERNWNSSPVYSGNFPWILCDRNTILLSVRFKDFFEDPY